MKEQRLGQLENTSKITMFRKNSVRPPHKNSIYCKHYSSVHVNIVAGSIQLKILLLTCHLLISYLTWEEKIRLYRHGFV